MLIRNAAKSARFASDKMQKVSLFETPRFFMDLYCLEPGQEQRAHSHAANDKVYFLLEGAAEVSVGAKSSSLGAGEAVLAPAGVQHGIANRGAARAVCLVFMAPHPRPEAQAAKTS